MRPAAAAASTSASPSAAESASGFSTHTCLPAWGAASASVWWRDGGVAITTASTSSRPTSSPRSSIRRSSGCSAPSAGSRLASRSQTSVTRTCGSLPNVRSKFPPQYPTPTIATFTRLSPSHHPPHPKYPLFLGRHEAFDVVPDGSPRGSHEEGRGCAGERDAVRLRVHERRDERRDAHAREGGARGPERAR